MRTCPKCKRELDDSGFAKSQKRCRECCSIRLRQWRTELRSDLLSMYGDSCACCGESFPPFLNVDHINMGGRKDRDTSGMCTMLKRMRSEYKPDLYRTLCSNCNMLASRVGNDITILSSLMAKNALFVYQRATIIKPAMVGEVVIKCTKCREEKPASQFTLDKGRYNGVRNTCSQCNAYIRLRHRQFERLEVLNHYGARCECCSTTFIPSLTIDHIGGMCGRRRVSQPQLYHSIIELGFPSDIRILCMNCNGAIVRCHHNLDTLRTQIQLWKTTK